MTDLYIREEELAFRRHIVSALKIIKRSMNDADANWLRARTALIEKEFLPPLQPCPKDDGTWVCEEDPDKPFEHAGCIGPGMPPAGTTESGCANGEGACAYGGCTNHNCPGVDLTPKEKQKIAFSLSKRIKKEAFLSRQKTPSLDIDEQVIKALEWEWGKHGCMGCNEDSNLTTPHTPTCLLLHHITTSRGANGRVVIENPHHSVHPSPSSI